MVTRLDDSIGSVRFACSRCGDIALPLVWLSYTVIRVGGNSLLVLNNAVFGGVSTWRDARLSITDAVDADDKLLQRGSYVTKYTSSINRTTDPVDVLYGLFSTNTIK